MFFRGEGLYHRCVQLFYETEDVVLLDEAHLQVELGVFRLPVGAGILVTEAAGYLEVLVHARDHQQLA